MPSILPSWSCAFALAALLTGCELPRDGEQVTIIARSGEPTLAANGSLADIHVFASGPRHLALSVVGGSVALLGAAPAASACLEAVAEGSHVYPVALGFDRDELVLSASLHEQASGPCAGAQLDSAVVAVPRRPSPSAPTSDGGSDASAR